MMARKQGQPPGSKLAKHEAFTLDLVEDAPDISLAEITAGLHLNGLAAPMVLDGPMNGDAFLTYIEQDLLPELAKGDVVVMDRPGNVHSALGYRPPAPETIIPLQERPAMN